MSPEALQLIARYVRAPNQRHRCGDTEDQIKLYNCIKTGDCHEIIPIIPHYPDLNKNLLFISLATGLDPFSYPVAEAYWRGNDLLEQFPHPPTHLSVVISQNNPDHHFLLLDGINACMITGGPIREIDPVTHTLRADLITLTATDYNFQIRPATYDPDLFPQLKEGDLITSHHGIVAEIIDRPALENLEKWTGIVIRNFISATPADQSHP